MKLTYLKLALEVDKLLELILKKEIIVDNVELANFCLKTVSYHRLLPYLESLHRNHHSFQYPKFSHAWQLYCFDRELRLLINDAIERIEIAFRTALSETMSCRYSPHWFLNKEIFKDTTLYNGFIKQVDLVCKNKHELYIQDYYAKYQQPKYPPSWIVSESLSLGACITAFYNLKKLSDRKAICQIFQEHPTTMQSWLYAIRYMRNLCAHHSRIWNRWFVVTPSLRFLLGDNFDRENTCYAHLFILNRLLVKISSNNSWKNKLYLLFEKYNNLPILEIGFQQNWQEDLFWD